MKLRYCIGLLLCLLSASIVIADPPQRNWRWWLYQPVCPTTGCCPDYVPKPLPCVPKVPCGGPDDYCRKPLPCVPLVPCGGPDDYCRKPLPCLLCPPTCPLGVPIWSGPR